jgi:glycine/D-amino acid oxidase-like deaminating enzyme
VIRDCAAGTVDCSLPWDDVGRMRASAGTDVIVVGAGIVGASVAYHAARRGAAVVLLDRREPASGVTGDSFAWIRGPGGEVDGSTPLRQALLDDWARLERDVPGIRVRWSGSLTWGGQTPSHVGELGSNARLVEADEIARLEPNLRSPPQRAVLRPTDGAIDAVAVTNALVDAARRHGAHIRLAETVRRLRVQNHAVVGVETSIGAIASRAVVLAAGVDVVPLCAARDVDLPVAASPAVLMRFNAPPGLVRTLVSSPEVEVRQTTDGLLLAAEDYTGEVDHNDLQRSARETLQRLKQTFTGAHDVRPIEARLGVRPMPVDGLPIIGPLPNRPDGFVAVMHSAVTLAPVAGRLIAAEVVDGLNSRELQHVRPHRFTTA